MEFSNRRGSSTHRARQSGCAISAEGKMDEPGMSPIILLNWTYPDLSPFRPCDGRVGFVAIGS